MTVFFFYKNLMNVELIKKISTDFTLNDGYIIIESYDSEKNILQINSKIEKNNMLLHGKIVTFNIKLEHVLEKMNGIEECKFKSKYALDTVFASRISGGVYKAHIIY